jgi:CRP-like cAMP-binding protein
MALLANEPRNATVVCETDCDLLELDREAFQAILAHDFAAALRAERLANRRSR